MATDDVINPHTRTEEESECISSLRSAWSCGCTAFGASKRSGIFEPFGSASQFPSALRAGDPRLSRCLDALPGEAGPGFADCPRTYAAPFPEDLPFSIRGLISAPNFDVSEMLGAAIGLDVELGTSHKKEGRLAGGGDA